MDMGHYRDILQQCFPCLDIAGITFIGGGTFRVFEVTVGHDLDPGTSASNTLIFRFPHSGQGDLLLQRERSLLNTLAALLPIPVPRYEHYARGCPQSPRPVAGYRKIPGMALQACAHSYSALQRLASQQ